MIGDIPRTPSEWEKLTGTKILDADGWSGENGRPWTDPITYDEWCERSSNSTQKMMSVFPID